jgi:hypothetical protein
MGCDIHIIQEVLIDGQWRYYNYRDSMGRDYEMFSVVAGVRGNEDPIVEPKGHPDNMDWMTKRILEYWKLDAHTKTWFGPYEIYRLKEWYEKTKGKFCFRFYEDFGYLFGNSWTSLTECPDAVPKDILNIRWIIWFDN